MVGKHFVWEQDRHFIVSHSGGITLATSTVVFSTTDSFWLWQLPCRFSTTATHFGNKICIAPHVPALAAHDLRRVPRTGIRMSPDVPTLDTHDPRRGLTQELRNSYFASRSRVRRVPSPQRVPRARSQFVNYHSFGHLTRTSLHEGEAHRPGHPAALTETIKFSKL